MVNEIPSVGLLPSLREFLDQKDYTSIIEQVRQIPFEQRDFNDHYFYIKALNRSSDIDTATSHARQILDEVQDLNTFQHLKLYYELVWGYYKQSDITQAKKFIQEGLKETSDLDPNTLPVELKSIYSSFINIVGITYYLSGELDLATQYFTQLLSLAEELDRDHHVQGAKINLGLIYRDKGQYKEALPYLHQALELAQENQDNNHIRVAANNLSDLYNLLGRLDQAEEMVTYTMNIAQETDRWGKAIALHNLGVIKYKRDKLHSAKEYLQQSIAIMDDFQNAEKLSRSLFYRLLIALLEEDRKLSREILGRIRDFRETAENPRIDLLYQLGEAIYLRHSSLFQHKTKSENMLRELIASDQELESDLISLAYLNLVELQLEQLEPDFSEKSAEEKRVRDELLEISDIILNRAETQNAPELVLQSLYIKANLAILDLNFDQARQKLQEALDLKQQLGLEIVTISEPDLDETNWPQFDDEVRYTNLKNSVNSIIHTLPRLKIMIALQQNTKLTFAELKGNLNLSAGNLSNHCKTLIEAGYVHKQKELIGDRFLTVYSLTPEGIREFNLYRSTIQPFLNPEG